ncbi:MAG: copper amine oxidase N-terminal domain-containing protein [Abditibacteriaceae bacterium]
MFKRIRQPICYIFICLLMTFVSLHAMAQNEVPLPLPPAPTESGSKPVIKDTENAGKEDVSQVKQNLQNLKLDPIAGKTPYYVDKGVTMIPIRPICDFLGLSITYRAGLISIYGTLPMPVAAQKDQPQKTDGNSSGTDANSAQTNTTIFVNFRDGSRVAQIIEGAHNRTSTLELAPETRLGVTFVPLRFLSVAFNAKVSYNAGTGLITVQSGDRLGYLRQPNQCNKNVKKTVSLTVANRVGRAFTLQLKGSCNFRIELGRYQKVVAKLPAGLYQYTAVSKGTYPRHGKRWLRKGATVNWTFGG